MTEDPRRTITRLLADWSAGREGAADELFPLVHRRLSAIAANLLRREHGPALETAELVHEAYLRLIDPSQLELRDRRHFFNLVARAMRQVLVDQARRRGAVKRFAERDRVPFDDAAALAVAAPDELLSLDSLLGDLERLDPRQAEVVGLRVFVGLEMAEIAEALSISLRSAKRDWRMARAWLAASLDRGGAETGTT